MRRRREDALATLGRLLDRRGIRDAFIALDAVGVNVTPISDGRAIGSRHYRYQLLARLASADVTRRRPVTPAMAHAARETVLRLAGRTLDRERCHAAFIVIYDDLLLIDDDRVSAANVEHTTPRRLSVAPVGG